MLRSGCAGSQRRLAALCAAAALLSNLQRYSSFLVIVAMLFAGNKDMLVNSRSHNLPKMHTTQMQCKVVFYITQLQNLREKKVLDPNYACTRSHARNKVARGIWVQISSLLINNFNPIKQR